MLGASHDRGLPAPTSHRGYRVPVRARLRRGLPAVAFEFWTEHVVGSGLDATYPYFHWVFPSTRVADRGQHLRGGAGRADAQRLLADERNWGDGPYGDGPPDGEDISEGGFWATADALPTADCAASAVTSTS